MESLSPRILPFTVVHGGGRRTDALDRRDLRAGNAPTTPSVFETAARLERLATVRPSAARAVYEFIDSRLSGDVNDGALSPEIEVANLVQRIAHERPTLLLVLRDFVSDLMARSNIRKS